MDKVIKLDGIWLCSESAAKTIDVPSNIQILVLTDGFLMAAENPYPMTQEGMMRVFLDWSEGAFVWVPNRKCFFVYEALEYSERFHTWGGAWRVQDSLFGMWHIPEHFSKEVISGKEMLLKFDLENLSEETRQSIWEMVKRADKRVDQAYSISSENIRKYVRKYSTREICFDELQHSGKLINFQNGVFDLETMSFRSSKQDDFMTYVLPVMYDPTAEAEELWPFLDKLFCGNEEVLEYTLGLLGLILDRTYLPKPVLLFFSERGSSGRSTFLRFLGNCLGPFVSNHVNDYASRNHPFFKKGNEFHLAHVSYPPRLKAIMFPTLGEGLSDMGWDELFYCGEGEPITYCCFDQPKFNDTGTILSVVEVNHLPALKANRSHLKNRLHVIPFEWENVSRDSLTFDDENAFCTPAVKSMFLNLLIEYYSYYVSRKFYKPYDMMELSKRCFQDYDQESLF